MSITVDSINKSSRITQIGFPEFTAKLITDTFNAIISANMSQQQAYLELVREVSKTLTQYITDTKDDISGSDILNILVSIVPDRTSQSGTIIRKDNTQTLTSEQANKINAAVSIPNTTIYTSVANTTSQISQLYAPILEAVANRVAADKYTMLQEMVRLGLVRLVVNNGELKTSLNFEARDSDFYERQSSDYNRSEYDFAATVQSGSITSLFTKYSVATRYSKVAVSTVDTTTSSTSSSAVQIAGSLKLNFSTDYQALSALTAR